MTKFRNLPTVGKVIIVAVAAGVFVVAGVAVATSYNAVYRLVGDLGLYSEGTTKTFGIMLDIAFILAEMAAILGQVLRATHLGRLPAGLSEDQLRDAKRQVSKGWPYATMVVCGLCTLAFNVLHAFLIGGADDPKTVWRCLVAAFPPVLMILAFQVLIAITRWVMLNLGRPLDSATALSSTGQAGYVPQVPASEWSAQQIPSSAPSEMPQNGHAEITSGGLAAGAKRAAIEQYLAGVELATLIRTNGQQVAQDVEEETGIKVSPRYADSILEQTRAARMANGDRKR